VQLRGIPAPKNMFASIKKLPNFVKLLGKNQIEGLPDSLLASVSSSNLKYNKDKNLTNVPPT